MAVIRLFFFLYPVLHLQSFYASLLPASPCLSPNCLYLASFLSSPPPPALSPICYLWHASSAFTQFMGVICCLKKLNNSFDLSGKMFPPLWQPEWCLLASLWILKKERKKSHSQEIWMKVKWGEMTTLTPWHTNQPSQILIRVWLCRNPCYGFILRSLQILIKSRGPIFSKSWSPGLGYSRLSGL